MNKAMAMELLQTHLRLHRRMAGRLLRTRLSKVDTVRAMGIKTEGWEVQVKVERGSGVLEVSLARYLRRVIGLDRLAYRLPSCLREHQGVMK